MPVRPENEKAGMFPDMPAFRLSFPRPPNLPPFRSSDLFLSLRRRRLRLSDSQSNLLGDYPYACQSICIQVVGNGGL